MYSQVLLCAVFILSVPFAKCFDDVILPPHKEAVNESIFNEVQSPQLSTLDKYLRSQKSFAIVNGNARSSSNKTSIGNQMLKIITSKNYPLPYPVPKVVKQRLSVSNSNGLDIIITDLDIDPMSDYISLTPINADGSESRPIILTGKLNEPLNIRSLGFTRANLIFEARTVPGHSYRGFSLSYGPYGELRAPSTQPPDYTLSYEQLETVSRLLVVPKKDQTNLTWNKLKELLANSSNSFIDAEKLTLEKASPANVSLTRVAECFENWPNSENCIEVEYAITLYNDSRLTPYLVDSFFEDLTPREPAGFSGRQLELIWEKFGREAFLQGGIEEYILPDTRSEILMWAGIAIGVCVLMFLVLVAVFRSPAFRDRWVEDDEVAIKPAEDKGKEATVDITMYPSPDQIIPEMYPGVHHNRSNTYDTINEERKEDDNAKHKNIKSGSTQATHPDKSV